MSLTSTTPRCTHSPVHGLGTPRRRRRRPRRDHRRHAPLGRTPTQPLRRQARRRSRRRGRRLRRRRHRGTDRGRLTHPAQPAPHDPPGTGPHRRNRSSGRRHAPPSPPSAAPATCPWPGCSSRPPACSLTAIVSALLLGGDRGACVIAGTLLGSLLAQQRFPRLRTLPHAPGAAGRQRAGIARGNRHRRRRHRHRPLPRPRQPGLASRSPGGKVPHVHPIFRAALEPAVRIGESEVRPPSPPECGRLLGARSGAATRGADVMHEVRWLWFTPVALPCFGSLAAKSSKAPSIKGHPSSFAASLVANAEALASGCTLRDCPVLPSYCSPGSYGSGLNRQEAAAGSTWDSSVVSYGAP